MHCDGVGVAVKPLLEAVAEIGPGAPSGRDHGEVSREVAPGASPIKPVGAGIHGAVQRNRHGHGGGRTEVSAVPGLANVGWHVSTELGWGKLARAWVGDEVLDSPPTPQCTVVIDPDLIVPLV